MTTFYKNLKHRDNTVILIKDSKDRVFGAFCCEEWHPSINFYGRDDCFVFTFEEEDIKMYRYTGTNFMIQYSDEKCLIIGGGKE